MLGLSRGMGKIVRLIIMGNDKGYPYYNCVARLVIRTDILTD